MIFDFCNDTYQFVIAAMSLSFVLLLVTGRCASVIKDQWQRSSALCTQPHVMVRRSPGPGSCPYRSSTIISEWHVVYSKENEFFTSICTQTCIPSSWLQSTNLCYIYISVHGEMHLKDLGSFVRVGYRIPFPDFCLVLHGLCCRKSTIMD